MLISYRNKFIFIHNYKVAGSSIKLALAKYALNSPTKYHWINQVCEPFQLGRTVNYYAANKISSIKNIPFHGTARKIKSMVGEERWNNYFTFGFVRNPWDWEVSIYHYILLRPKHFQYATVKSLGNFDNYIRWRLDKNKHTQVSFFCDDDGNLIVDYIAKYESLEKEFDTICNVLNIKASLPHINKSNHKNYRSYYSKETQQLVEQLHKKDIEQFNYQF